MTSKREKHRGRSVGLTLARALPYSEAIVFGLLFSWLAAAAVLVDVEYYDGFDSIRNARYFLGNLPGFVPTRGPIVGLLLVPAQWVADAMHLHPLEVRPHHALFALVHAAYLVATYAITSRMYGRSPAVLLAFLAAVPTYLFFSYAPFISHDLFPGVLFLSFLLATERLVRRPTPGTWLTVFLLGTVSVLVKHTFAVFWIVAGIVHVVVRPTPSDRRFPAVALYALAMVLSGAVSFVILGWVLRDSLHDLSLFERATRQARFLLFEAGARDVAEPVWVYLRNWPAYGPLAMLLLPFGLVLSYREGGRQRRLALAWILSAVALHLTPLRQVRYLLFLAPLTVCLLVPVVRSILNRSGWLPLAAGAVLLIGFLPVHPYSAGREAARITIPFYRHSEAKAFLAPLGGRTPVYHNLGLLSFVPPDASPLAGDVYHGIFHLGPEQLADLLGYAQEEWVVVDPDAFRALAEWPERAAFLATARGPQFNPPTWRGGRPIDVDEQRETIYLADRIRVVRTTEGLETTDGAPVTITPRRTDRGEPLSVVSSAALNVRLDPALPMRARLPGGERPYLVQAVGPEAWVVPREVPTADRASDDLAVGDATVGEPGLGERVEMDSRVPLLELDFFRLASEWTFGEPSR